MAPNPSTNEDRFRQIWDGDSETDCVEVCRDLQKAGIEYRTTQHQVSRTSRMGVEWKFKVYVLNLDYQSAKRALGLGEQTKGDDSVFEMEEKTATDSDFNHDYKARSRAYLNYWDSELATVEVGSQPPTDESSMVELSLTENLIHYRVKHLKNGARKYFVHAEDEARAREIIREIKTGDPPS
jgi:hypothetical protein